MNGDFSFLNVSPGDEGDVPDDEATNYANQQAEMERDPAYRKDKYKKAVQSSKKLRDQAVASANDVANTAHMYPLQPKDRATFEAVKPSYYGKDSREVNLPGLADDFDQIAKSGTMDPDFAGKLTGAAHALRGADAAESEEMNRQQIGEQQGDFKPEPSAAPSEDPQQYAKQADDINKKVESLNAQIKRSGVLGVGDLTRQRDDLNKQAQDLRKKQFAAESAIKNAPMQGPEEAPLDHALNMKAVLTAAGWSRQDFIQANSEMYRGLMAHGISPNDPVTPSTFPIIVPKIVEEAFSPQVAAKWYQEIIGPEPKQEERPKDKSTIVSDDLEKDPRFADVSQRLEASRLHRDAIWKELANSGTFNNVGDVIGFVLSSIVLGPTAACALFTNMNKNGQLRHELDLVNHETGQLFHEQNSYIELSRQAKNQALNQERERDALREAKRHHLEMEGVQYQKMRSLVSKFSDPETKAIASARLHGLRIAESNLAADKENLNRLEKAANNPMDPRFKVAKAALAKETQNYAAKVQQMKEYRAQLQKWFEDNATRVGDLLNPGGTAMNSKSFASTEDE